MRNVGKAVFPTLLKKFFEKRFEENAVSGFRGSRIFPPDKDVFKRRIFCNCLQHWETHHSGYIMVSKFPPDLKKSRMLGLGKELF